MMALSKKKVTGGLVLLGLAIMLLLPRFADDGVVFFAGVTYLYIVFAFSWNLMFSFTGMASFGHAAFLSIGAYFYAVMAKYYPGIPYLALMLLTGVFGFVIAAVIGAAIVRRTRGVYFAILTISFGQVVYLIISKIPALGREDGFSGIKRPVLSLGAMTLDLGRGNNFYYFVVLFSVVLLAVFWWIVNSRTGRRFRSVQQDVDRAEFLGVNVYATRLWSFTISSSIAAMIGSVYAPMLQLVTPELGYFIFSAQPILYTMLGGMGSFWGPALGGAVFGVLTYSTRTLIGVSDLTIGVTLIAVILLLPAGLVGLFGLVRSLGKYRGKAGQRPERIEQVVAK